MNTELLFTYGTLRREERNHVFLSHYAPDFVGHDAIQARAAGSLGDIPMIEEGEGTIQGEVYRVSPEAIKGLDRFEGVYVGMYRRQQVTTLSGQSVWVYYPTESLLSDVRQAL